MWLEESLDVCLLGLPRCWCTVPYCNLQFAQFAHSVTQHCYRHVMVGSFSKKAQLTVQSESGQNAVFSL